MKYTLFCELANARGCGYEFPCDASGAVHREALKPAARQTWDDIDVGKIEIARFTIRAEAVSEWWEAL